MTGWPYLAFRALCMAGHPGCQERNTMRSVIIAAMAALAVLAMVSIGNAQNDQRPSDPSNVPAERVPAARDTNGPTPTQNGSTPTQEGITPAQEEAIPYRPCNTNVELANGRHACLNDR